MDDDFLCTDLFEEVFLREAVLEEDFFDTDFFLDTVAGADFLATDTLEAEALLGSISFAEDPLFELFSIFLTRPFALRILSLSAFAS